MVRTIFFTLRLLIHGRIQTSFLLLIFTSIGYIPKAMKHYLTAAIVTLLIVLDGAVACK